MEVIIEFISTVVAPAAQIFLAMTVAYLASLWVALIFWTYRDIEARSRSVVTQVFATLLAIFFFVPGVLLYMLLRPKETLDEAYQRVLQEEYLLQDLEELPLCPTCRHYVQADYVMCPYCNTRLRENCPSCQRLVELRWNTCPYCTAGLPSPGEDETATEAETLAPPKLPEWVTPALERLREKVLTTRDQDQRRPALRSGRSGRPAEGDRARAETEALPPTPPSNGHHAEVEPEAPPSARSRNRRGGKSQSLENTDSTPSDGMVTSKRGDRL